MDKAEIRAKARELCVEVVGTAHEYDDAESLEFIEDALTAAHAAGAKAEYNKGWDERGEADEQAINDLTIKVPWIVLSTIRRLKKGNKL